MVANNKKLILIIGAVLLFLGGIIAAAFFLSTPSDKDQYSPATIVDKTLQASYAFEDSFSNITGLKDVYSVQDDSLIEKVKADFSALQDLTKSLQSLSSIGSISEESWTRAKSNMGDLLERYETNVNLASYFVTGFFVPLNKLLAEGDTSVSVISNREQLAAISSDPVLLELDESLGALFQNLQSTIKKQKASKCISFDEEIIIDYSCDGAEAIEEEIVAIEDELREILRSITGKLTLAPPRVRDILLPISEALTPQRSEE